MENNKPSLKNIAYTYGSFLALVSIVVLVIMYVANLEKSWILSGISFALTIFIIVQGIKAYKKSNDNYLSLKDALKSGMAIAAIAGVIGGIYAYFHYEFIHTEFIENILSQSREQMIERNPNMTDEEMEMGMKMTAIFSSPFMMATFSLIGTLFFGFIISLISGAIMKREKPQI